MNAVTTTQPKSVLVDMATRFGMEPSAFELTVRATCSPAPKKGEEFRPLTREEFAAFLLVAKHYNLNPLTREIYAYPKRGGGVVPIVSIDGWINLVNSNEASDGFEFEIVHDEKGNLDNITCKQFRKDRSRPTTVTEYLSECWRDTDPWKMKHRMLRHKAFIQSARYAFGFSGIYDEDEGAKIAEMKDVTPPQPPKPPAPPSEFASMKAAIALPPGMDEKLKEQGLRVALTTEPIPAEPIEPIEVYDASTGEVTQAVQEAVQSDDGQMGTDTERNFLDVLRAALAECRDADEVSDEWERLEVGAWCKKEGDFKENLTACMNIKRARLAEFAAARQ